MSPGILQYARMVAFSNFRYPYPLTASLIHTGHTVVKLDVSIWSRTPRRPEGTATLSKSRSRYAEYIDSQLKTILCKLKQRANAQKTSALINCINKLNFMIFFQKPVWYLLHTMYLHELSLLHKIRNDYSRGKFRTHDIQVGSCFPE